jgi:uncharacterized protein YaaW (UPF0174 family)
MTAFYDTTELIILKALSECEAENDLPDGVPRRPWPKIIAADLRKAGFLAQDFTAELRAAGIMDDRQAAFDALMKVSKALGIVTRTMAAKSVTEVGDMLAEEAARLRSGDPAGG